MRALKTIQQFLSDSLQEVHKKRLGAVFWAVGVLMFGNRLSLTAIGRAAKGEAYTKHNIKRVDRLLGNKHLHTEITPFYRAIAKMLIGSQTRPVVLIDWTGAGDKHWALVAAIPMDGRAMPILTRVYSEKKNNNPVIHRMFLRNLRKILPKNCKPIIVTDAGFSNGWFKDVVSWGWDYVGRIITNAHVCSDKRDTWFPSFNLFKKATFKAKDIGSFWLSKQNMFFHRFVIIKQKHKGRKNTCQHGGEALAAKNRSEKPWLLATSLKHSTADKVVKIYETRMQIEESFRDIKNHRYGWSFRHARSNSKSRKEVLFLIAAIAMLALMLVGQTGERFNYQKHYQANTIHAHRVLSLFFLGKNMLEKEGKLLPFLKTEYRISLEILKEKSNIMKAAS